MNLLQFRLLLLPLLLLSLSLSGCEAGDIGSSSSNSSASVDNSEDDHSVRGDTSCTFKCTVSPESVSFERICEGVEVASGNFTNGVSCQQAAAQFGGEGDVVEETSGSGFVLQGPEAGTL